MWHTRLSQWVGRALLHVVLVTQPSIVSVRLITAQRTLGSMAQHSLFPARGRQPGRAQEGGTESGWGHQLPSWVPPLCLQLMLSRV